MEDSIENKWFKNASESFTDMAHMLMALDEKGVIPTDMRKAISQHANNSLDVLPMSIAAIASSLAAAVYGSVGLQKGEASNVAWGMASMAEQMHGWQELADCFRNADGVKS